MVNLFKKQIKTYGQSAELNEYARILIVDDDKNMTRLLSEILKEIGHRVDCVHNAEDAMNLIETENYFIVISDIQLPGHSGIELLKSIKMFNNLIQVFMMTAHSNRERVVECLKAGATDYFEKPFHAEDIVLSIHSAIYRIGKWAKMIVNSP